MRACKEPPNGDEGRPSKALANSQWGETKYQRRRSWTLDFHWTKEHMRDARRLAAA